jgi:nitric oxide reductase subunit B
LYVAPMLFVRDPKSQAFGMNFLFVSLIIIVAGSFIG